MKVERKSYLRKKVSSGLKRKLKDMKKVINWRNCKLYNLRNELPHVTSDTKRQLHKRKEGKKHEKKAKRPHIKPQTIT